jgi:NAD(P)-dependent dehydrogenase (short-subunit alcohol dehydrogenase family)
MPELPLHGKLALVTGASKGLGKAVALALAEAGAQLVLVSRNQDLLDGTAMEIRSNGGSADVIAADISDEAQVMEMEREFVKRFGRLQILVNNAGINLRKPVTGFTLEEWNRILHTNLTSAFLVCRSLVPHMKGQGYGRIINMTSMMSHVALPDRTAYAASKAGLLGFTRALALELAPEGITVNGISPGPCATEINKPLMESPELTEFFLSRIPVGRWGRPEEVAGLAVYLCLDQAAFITGTDLVIDGGWSAQ